MGVLALADLTAWLPAGCALWRSMGGPFALTMEARMLAAVDFRLQVQLWADGGGKGPRPTPPKETPWRDEVQAANARKAAAFLRREARLTR